MGWKDFFANVIDSLAWPAAIVFIFFLLRKPLRRVILGLRRIGYRNLALEFGDVVEEAAERAELPPPERRADEMALSTQLAEEISTAPRAAVIEAWIAVQEELEDLALRSDADLAERQWTPEALIHALRNQGVIDADLASVLRDIKRARDLAAHVQPYTVEPADVAEYVKLAGRVRDALRESKERLGEPDEEE